MSLYINTAARLLCFGSAEISRKTGISKNRLSELSTKESAKIRGEEIYLIALAIAVSPTEILDVTCGGLKLRA